MSEDALIRRTNLKNLGLGPSELVGRIGKSYQYWRDLMETNKSFGEKAARNIEEKLGLQRGQLDMVVLDEAHTSRDKPPLTQPNINLQIGTTAHHRMNVDRELVGEASRNTNNTKQGNVDPTRGFTGEVPVISWVQAGAWQDTADTFQPEDAERHLPIFKGHSGNTYALKVRGDSMNAPYGRSYPEGCYIVVDPEKRSPVNGDRIIAITPGSKEATFKIYKDEDGRRWLAPLNTTHQIILEPFEVLGTVIGKWEDE